jgi:hypothetical protein
MQSPIQYDIFFSLGIQRAPIILATITTYIMAKYIEQRHALTPTVLTTTPF